MDEKPFESLNVIPFVDIMLVLLTMVLTTATFIATGRIPIDLPQAAATKNGVRKEVVIEITASGEVRLDGATLDAAALRERLAALPKDAPIAIHADRSVAFQYFVDVADLLKQLSFSKVGVQTHSVTVP
jgi:biopolymer transport protein ExbD